jgi:hypothetical protein
MATDDELRRRAEETRAVLACLNLTATAALIDDLLARAFGDRPHLSNPETALMGRVADLEAENRRLHAAAEEAIAVLRRLQHYDLGYCPVCGAEDGHDGGCALSLALTALDVADALAGPAGGPEDSGEGSDA